MTQLEQDLRSVTGRVESLSHQVRQLNDKLEKLSSDLDMRFDQMRTSAQPVPRRPGRPPVRQLVPPVPPGRASLAGEARTRRRRGQRTHPPLFRRPRLPRRCLRRHRRPLPPRQPKRGRRPSRRARARSNTPPPSPSCKRATMPPPAPPSATSSVAIPMTRWRRTPATGWVRAITRGAITRGRRKHFRGLRQEQDRAEGARHTAQAGDGAR